MLKQRQNKKIHLCKNEFAMKGNVFRDDDDEAILFISNSCLWDERERKKKRIEDCNAE